MYSMASSRVAGDFGHQRAVEDQEIVEPAIRRALSSG